MTWRQGNTGETNQGLPGRRRDAGANHSQWRGQGQNQEDEGGAEHNHDINLTDFNQTGCGRRGQTPAT